MSRRSLARILLLALWSAALVAAGWQARARLGRPGAEARERRVRQGGTRLTSPLLDVELPEGYGVEREPIPFKYKVERFVAERTRDGRVRSMSVYWRDLMDGPWLGVHLRRKYNPASMMKVPVMIAWLKRAERDPGELRRTFVFDPRIYPGPPQRIDPARTLQAGKAYAVEELLRHMMAWSDNRAMWMLYGGLDGRELDDVIDSMDVTNDPADGQNAMSVHGYSGFFRILFNASYLSREMSERALELLAQQDFPRGISAGVPAGVTVAGKFGEWSEGQPGSPLQLHEFAIVYHPRAGPYILGVMTEGTDWDAQADAIRDASRLVYEELAAQADARKASPRR